MTSIEDWSLSTLYCQIFRQQNPVATAIWELEIFLVASLVGTGPTGLQLRSGNLRFGGGPSWKATGLQLQSANSWFVWWQDEGDSYNCYLGTRVGGWAGPVRLQCETWVFLAA